MTKKRSGKEAAANDESATGGRRTAQRPIPGVREGVHDYPDVDDAMKELADDLDAVNDAKTRFEEQRMLVQGLLQKHKVPGLSYSAHGVMVGAKHNETKLFVRRLKSPKKKDENTEAA